MVELFDRVYYEVMLTVDNEVGIPAEVKRIVESGDQGGDVKGIQ